jgi:hypothetical protein
MVTKCRHIIVGRHLILPILTAAVTFSSMYWPSTPPYASLKKEAKGNIETAPISDRRHMFYLFLRLQLCYALWKSARLYSGTPTRNRRQATAAIFFYLSLRRNICYGSSAPSCFAHLTTYGFPQALPLLQILAAAVPQALALLQSLRRQPPPSRHFVVHVRHCHIYYILWRQPPSAPTSAPSCFWLCNYVRHTQPCSLRTSTVIVVKGAWRFPV